MAYGLSHALPASSWPTMRAVDSAPAVAARGRHCKWARELGPAVARRRRRLRACRLAWPASGRHSQSALPAAHQTLVKTMRCTWAAALLLAAALVALPHASIGAAQLRYAVLLSQGPNPRAPWGSWHVTIAGAR